jgi:hypothetical protein
LYRRKSFIAFAFQMGRARPPILDRRASGA